MEIIFSKNNQNNHVCRNDLDDDVNVDGDFFLRITKTIMYAEMFQMISWNV